MGPLEPTTELLACLEMLIFNLPRLKHAHGLHASSPKIGLAGSVARKKEGERIGYVAFLPQAKRFFVGRKWEL